MSNDISAVLLDLRPIQDKISKSETESILERWEFGRILVGERGDKKQLPNGMRADIADVLGLDASEITRRMQLAEKFTTQEEVVDACNRHGGAWRTIIREELVKRRDGGGQRPTAWGDSKKATLDRWCIEVNGDDARHAELVKLMRAALDALTDGADTDSAEVPA